MAQPVPVAQPVVQPVPQPAPVAQPVMVPAPVAQPVVAEAMTAPLPVQTAPMAAQAAAPTMVMQPADQFVSPFDEYSDETHPHTAASDDDETDTHHPWSAAQKGILIGVIALVVALGVVLGMLFGVVLPNKHALQSAQASFQTAAQNFTDAQTALSTQIDAATPASAVQATDVNDATTVTALQTALTSAQALVADPPAMASGTSAINQQVTDLNNQTDAVNNATQTLQSAVSAVQQSRVDLAVANLKTVLNDAQGSYDSASYMGDTQERTQLKSLIDQATAATTDPSTLGSDTDSIVAALQALTPNLQTAIDAVNAANTVTANKTFTYLLQGDQVTCGVNVCYNGVGGGDPSTVESVQVTVKGKNVTAKLCFMSTEPVDPTTCKVTTGTDGNNGWSEAWTGTRDGTTATIISTTKDKADFSWGTLTFDSSAPNAAVTAFAAADSCEKSDGVSYGQLVNGSCQ